MVATPRTPPTRLFGYLAAAMAHEVRNPLNSMAIHVELLEARLRALGGQAARQGANGYGTAEDKDKDKESSAARSLATLRQDIARIDRVLERYLVHVGPEEGPRQLVDVGQLVGAACERAKAEADRRGVTLGACPWEGAETPRWPVDEAALGLALDLLIDNALEATPRGRGVTIAASSPPDEGSNEPFGASAADGGIIEISDEGEGIAADALARLHELGYSKRAEHAGLGLTVARQIIKGLGGSLTLRSDGPGLGATARIELPLDSV